MGSGKIIYSEGGDTAHTLLEWGHCTYFVEVGTPYNIDGKSLAVGGWGVVQTRK